MESTISSYCRIKDGNLWLNGELFLRENKEEDLSAFLNSVYKKIELNYPKFFKMDKLCKLGVLAAEFVIRNTADFGKLSKEHMALVLSNSASSLDSDRNHISAIADKSHYFPSPSVFVYTLPNIVIGEIAIKHRITGENAFFVNQHFDAVLLHDYCELLFKNKAAQSALCGWVNVDGAEAEAFVYCVKNLNFKQENQGFLQAHNANNIQKLYNSEYGSTGDHQ